MRQTQINEKELNRRP